MRGELRVGRARLRGEYIGVDDPPCPPFVRGGELVGGRARLRDEYIGVDDPPCPPFVRGGGLVGGRARLRGEYIGVDDPPCPPFVRGGGLVGGRARLRGEYIGVDDPPCPPFVRGGTLTRGPARTWKLGRFRAAQGLCLLVCAVLAAPPQSILAQEGATPPHWIWHPNEMGGTQFPAETRYFRKSFAIKEPSRLVIEATADNSFVLYLDGKRVLEGADWNLTQSYAARLPIGQHVLAAVATNQGQSPAGLLVRGGILPLGQNVPIHSDTSWLTAPSVPAGEEWTRVGFDDSKWIRARPGSTRHRSLGCDQERS